MAHSLSLEVHTSDSRHASRPPILGIALALSLIHGISAVSTIACVSRSDGIFTLNL